MKLEKLIETGKDEGTRLTPVLPLMRSDETKRMLSAIINIDSEDKRQTIYGFGGALTESASYALSLLSAEKRESVIDAYFKDASYTIARTHINSCDFSLENWSISNKIGEYDTTRADKYILPLLKDSNARASAPIKIMVSPWSPPAYMKTNSDMNNGGKLKKEYYGEWAKLYVKYLEHLRENGLSIWALSVQNETEAVQIWDSCLYTAEEETEFVDDYLYPELERAGFGSIKILVWDHNRDGLYRRLSGSLKNSKGHISGAAYHWYSGAQYDNVAKCRKEFPMMDLIFSEGSIEGGARKGKWFPGERYAHNIINDLNAGCNAWIDWNIALCEDGGPNHVGNFCDAPVLISERGEISYQSSYYYIAHFSKYIEPGAKIVKSTIESWMTPQTVDGRIEDYMEAMAAYNPDGSLVLVVMNRTEADMLFTINISKEVKSAVGYTSRESGESVVYRCPERSIQTYIFR